MLSKADQVMQCHPSIVNGDLCRQSEPRSGYAFDVRQAGWSEVDSHLTVIIEGAQNIENNYAENYFPFICIIDQGIGY